MSCSAEEREGKEVAKTEKERRHSEREEVLYANDTATIRLVAQLAIIGRLIPTTQTMLTSASCALHLTRCSTSVTNKLKLETAAP